MDTRHHLLAGTDANLGRGKMSVKILATSFFVLSSMLIPFTSQAEESPWFDCHSLDIVEFGLISDGNISSPWTEAELLLKYGPPCTEIRLGAVYIERRAGRVVEITPELSAQRETVLDQTAEKKQLIYVGDYTDKTSVITIIDGIVVKKERIYD